MFSRSLRNAMIMLISLSAVMANSVEAFAWNNGDAVTLTKTVNVQADALTSGFPTTNGLRNWGIAIDDGKAYGIVYDRTAPVGPHIQITCNNLSDGSVCNQYPLDITNYAVEGTYTSGYIDPATHYLYTFATRDPVNSGSGNYPNGVYGVLCINLTQTPSTTCGFTDYQTKSGNPYFADTTPVIYSNRMYVLRQSTGANNRIDAGTNTMYCFDLNTLSPCANQPFLINSTKVFPAEMGNPGFARLEQVGSSQYVIQKTAKKLFCFNMATNSECSGTWPVQPTVVNLETALGNIAPIIDVASDNAATGFCINLSTASQWSCWDMSGTATSIPTNLGVAIPGGDANTVNAIRQLDSRIYAQYRDTPVSITENGSPVTVYESSIRCYDFATSAACAGFSNHLTGAYHTNYTYVDPANPTCMWVSSDSGDSQTQNFDAFTGGHCGAGGSRIMFSRFFEPSLSCLPTSYKTLTLNSPTDYTTAKVTFLSDSGASLGIAQQTFDSNRQVDLSGLSLPRIHRRLPQMLIELRNGSNNLMISSISATITWGGTYDTSCLARGQSVFVPTITSDAGVVVESGNTYFLQATSNLTAPVWSIDGGANAALFSIDSSGRISFINPAAVGQYTVNLKAVAGGQTATQTLTVNVVDTTPPSFTVTSPLEWLSTHTGATSVVSSVSESCTFTLGGPDSAHFTLTSNGALSFNGAVTGGSYAVTLTCTDPSTNATTHPLIVNVTDVVEVGQLTAASRQRTQATKTIFRWNAAANAVGYEVRRGSTVLCATESTSCLVNSTYSDTTQIYVFALGPNSTSSSALTVVLAPVKISLGTITFRAGVSRLDSKSKKKLNAIITSIRTAGYKTITLNGYADKTGNAKKNLTIGKSRTLAVWLYLKKKLKGVTVVHVAKYRTAKKKSVVDIFGS